MKTYFIATAASLIIGGLSYAVISLQSANSRLDNQLQAGIFSQQQITEQTEAFTLERLELESRLVGLEQELLEASSQITSLNDALAEATQREDPQYEALLEKARREAAQQTVGGDRRAFRMFSDPATARLWAENRIAGSFANYLDGLSLSSSEINSLYQVMLEFNQERYQMLEALMAGNLTADQAASVFGPDAMIDNLTGLMSSEQAAELDAFQLGTNREAARKIYAEALQSNGSPISNESQDLVLDVLLDELFSEQNNYGALVDSNGSMTTAYNDKLDAFGRARNRLERSLDLDELSQFDSFIQSQEGTVDLVMDASNDDAGNPQLRNIKVSAENLPN